MRTKYGSVGLGLFINVVLGSLVVFAVGRPGPDPSAQKKYLADHPGEISINISQKSLDQVVKTCRLSPSEAGDLDRVQKRLVEVIRLQPAAKPPRGVFLNAFVKADPPLGAGKAGMPARPVMVFCYVMFNGIFEQDGRPAWGTDSPVEMSVYLNDPEHSGYASADYESAYRDPADREIFYQPRTIGDAQGYAVYEGSRGLEVVVLARGQRPVWVPLTQEEFLKREIRVTEKMINESPEAAKDPANPLVARLARHKAVLAALPPSQRAAQAWYRRNEDLREPNLAPPGSEDARALVVVDPEWFDPSLPRTAVQLISVTFNYGPSFDPADPKPWEDGSVEGLRLWEMKRTMDWRSIGSLLAK